MKYLLAMAMVASTVVGFSAAANAAGGCGPGWHRGPYGACRPNAAVYVAPRVYHRPVVVVPARRACPYGFVWAYGRCRPI
ncbi:MAG: hypothetical protein HY852_22535 [Bradyrhizobium sp.]|uniref:GCG_CRPN prefix-to-repeats domain-containing protein n=1 Tax=Bradyrhizobium sp. TaxID=376 RepID=UPI0025BBBF55|nr:hypothetical protein [Bradyrhizobium sp.]MBI5264581.1 hypothetical protein [Bradyrhizobium sp.]